MAPKRPRPSAAGLRQAKAYELFLGLHCRHVDNDFYGEPFILEDWQRKNIWNPVLATGSVVDGRFRRHYRRALVGVPRDGGKSELAAGLLLTIANMEPVHGGEYGVIASSKSQAVKTFRKIKSMVLQDPELSAAWEVLTTSIRHRETEATIWVFPYSEAAAQGYHFNVCIIEELHVHRSTAVLDAVISGQKSIPGALTIVITTAGPRRSGPLWETLEQWRDDPYAYVYWLGASDTDRIDDQRVWRKVKPMSWISMQDIEDQFAGTSRTSFERYTLNRFPLKDHHDSAFSARQLSAAFKRKSSFDWQRPFVVGIDGAQSGDAFAIICVQRAEDGSLHFVEYVFDDPPDGGFYDLVQIEQLIAELYARGRPLVAIDPSRLLLMAQHLEQQYRVPVVGVKQGNEAMCAATALLQTAVRSGKAHLGGCPKLREHMGNAIALDREPYGQRLGSVGTKGSKKLIDAAIAAAIALYAMETQAPVPSFAATGGVWTING